MEAKDLIPLRAIALFSLTVITLTLWAQTLETPQNEFVLSLSKEQLELSRGEKGGLEIMVLKSKRYQKSNAIMGVSSPLPEGVTITFSPAKGNFDSSTANISIATEAIPGQYMLILNATLNNTTKGMILKLLID